MSSAAKSIFIFGIYVVVTGFTFMIIPNTILSMNGLPESKDVWVHMAGLSGVILGYYYIQAGRHELIPFFRATLYGRSAFFLGLILFVALGLAKPILISFGVIDVAGVIWTGLALRSQKA